MGFNSAFKGLTWPGQYIFLLLSGAAHLFTLERLKKNIAPRISALLDTANGLIHNFLCNALIKKLFI
jgi:hypothetical protein